MTEAGFHRIAVELVGGPLDGEVRDVLSFDGEDGPKFGILILPPLVLGPGRALRYRHAKGGWPLEVWFEFDGYE